MIWRITALALLWCATACGQSLVEYNAGADNADAIEACIKAGKTIPPGIYYVRSTIELDNLVKPSTGATWNANGNWLVGATLQGSGAPHAVTPEGLYYPDTPKRATILVWTGEPDGVMLRIKSPCFTVRDIGLWGRRVANIDAYKALNVTEMTGTLVEIVDQQFTYPVSYAEFDRVHFGAARKAIDIPATQPATHCDHVSARRCRTHLIYDVYTVDNQQSLAHDLEFHCYGHGHDVLNFKRGGRVNAKLVVMDDWETLLRLGPGQDDGTPLKGTARYGDGHFAIEVMQDNGSHIKNAVIETDTYDVGGAQQGQSAVTITGSSAGHSDGPNSGTSIGPPIIKHSQSRITVDVTRLVRPDITWPK